MRIVALLGLTLHPDLEVPTAAGRGCHVATRVIGKTCDISTPAA